MVSMRWGGTVTSSGIGGRRMVTSMIRSDEVTGYQRMEPQRRRNAGAPSLGITRALADDSNGNRTQVTGVGADSYAVNSLNEYTSDTNTGHNAL